jgi:membrane-bound inhibitor of C-type lysozyme
MKLNEVNDMNGLAMRCGIAAVALGWFAAVGIAQEAPAAPAPPAQAHNNVRPAIKWKRSDYTCEGGAKVTVYVHDQVAKVRHDEQVYLMKEAESREGKRYSDGKVSWWEKENGAFLQEDTPDGDGKMMVKGCKVVKP